MTTGKPTVVIVDNSVAFTGAFKAALQQANLLKERYRFVFVLPSGSTVSPQIEEAGFPAYSIPMLEIRKSVSTLLFYVPTLVRNSIRLSRIVKREGAALLVMNDVYNLLGVLIKQQKKIGLVTYVRFLPEVFPSPLRKTWVGLAQRYSDFVIAVSDAVLNQLPIKANTIRLYDAVEFLEKRLPKERNGSGVTTFLYLANYIQGKGQDHALAAFIRAYNQNKNIRLVFMGGDMGLKKNQAFKQLLQNKVAANGLSNVVDFRPFITDVEAAMKSADVVLNFSEAESFSMTVAEACNYGLPVIASRCGGPEEIIVDGVTGLLVENKNIEQMAAAMLRLASDAAWQQSFGTNAREYMKEKFSAAIFTASCTRLYDKAIQSLAR